MSMAWNTVGDSELPRRGHPGHVILEELSPRGKVLLIRKLARFKTIRKLTCIIPCDHYPHEAMRLTFFFSIEGNPMRLTFRNNLYGLIFHFLRGFVWADSRWGRIENISPRSPLRVLRALKHSPAHGFVWADSRWGCNHLGFLHFK